MSIAQLSGILVPTGDANVIGSLSCVLTILRRAGHPCGGYSPELPFLNIAALIFGRETGSLSPSPPILSLPT